MSGGLEHLVLSGPVLLAMPVAVAAGAITFLSPCCLPLVPGYLSYVTGMSGTAVAGTAVAGRGLVQTAGPTGPTGLALADGSTTVAGATLTLAPAGSTQARGRVVLGTTTTAER